MAEPKKAEKAPEKSSSPEAKSGSVKIAHMSLAQVEEAVDKTEKQMGGLHSKYAKALVAHMENLFQKVSFDPHSLAEDEPFHKAA